MRRANPLNPAAGDVPVPEDPREISAAMRAGRISKRLFPYIAWRYGERGEKFTHSDSAWLAWLAHSDQGRVSSQVAWLHAVLSNRGLPGLILETHLRVLQRQLARAVPEQASDYERLAVSARKLQEKRAAAIPAPLEDELTTEFATATGNGPTPWLTGTARLILSAVADETSGIKNAVTSLTKWLADVGNLRGLTELEARLDDAERRRLHSDALESRWHSAVEATVERGRRERNP